MSGYESGAKENNECEKAFVKANEYVLCQNKDYVEGATCWSSNWLYHFANPQL